MEKIPFHCPICHKTFMWYPSDSKRRHYCSMICRNKAYSILRRGENNNLWKGGIALIARYIRTSKTMKNWIKDVLEAQGNTCIECGKPACHVHHIKSISEFLAEMFAISNGEPLCDDCHSHKPNHNSNFVRRPRPNSG